jgi:Short C-terminal domain
MKLWNWGLVLLASGLFLVPATYFTIITTELPVAARTALFLLWILGVLLVPVGFTLLMVSAVRGPGRRPPRAASGTRDSTATPEHTGLLLILLGLVLAPLCFLAVAAGPLGRPAELVAYVVGALAVLAVPVGCTMYVYGVRGRDDEVAAAAQVPAAADHASPPAGAPDADLAEKLDALHDAGVLSDEEYAAKRSALQPHDR